MDFSGEEWKKTLARFYELLAAVKTPVQPDSPDTPIIFDAGDTDVRQTFGTSKVGEELLKNGIYEIELSGRTINLYLLPDKNNLLFIYVGAIENKKDGESFSIFAGAKKPTADFLTRALHKYFTDKAFKEKLISESNNYQVLSKKPDSVDDFLNANITVIPPDDNE